MSKEIVDKSLYADWDRLTGKLVIYKMHSVGEQKGRLKGEWDMEVIATFENVQQGIIRKEVCSNTLFSDRMKG